MIVKVCGLRDKENHQNLSNLNIDMIGINFYKPSSRYIGEHKLDVVKSQKRVGVFVHSSIDHISESKKIHKLDYAQLHGDEEVDYCQKVKNIIPIIKVFRIENNFDWSETEKYLFADYFLFDTMTEKFGGSGNKFDWSSLNDYKANIPFFLSGGIGPNDAKEILEIDHKYLVGVDINSKFESSPAIKNIPLVKKFITEYKN